MDVGASTGGFTHVLLQRGAAHVYAVDVGTAQLHASLRDDPRVTNLERTDARKLSRTLIPEAPSLIVCDASFIGAAKVLLVPMSLAAAHADLIVLIKPQFEAGPNAGKRGVLNEGAARDAAQATMIALDGVEHFKVVRMIDSPIAGGDGNLELLLHARR
jgi:23S rRNA (cytidine1920-2'-O)/16S rRNA (cytidine1409-2'-O)-methyltransferase